MTEDEKNVLLEVAGDFHVTEDGSICTIEISSAAGIPLTPQIIVDAVVDMAMAHYQMSKEDWARMEDEDLDS